MNKFLHYINEVLESLDIHTSIRPISKTSSSASRAHSKNNHLEEN